MTPAPPPSARLHSLDGLRGVAALLVLVHHCLLLFPGLAEVRFATDQQPPLTRWERALSYTPLHVVWAGTESVYLFFVLSGIVLVLPVLARPGFSWLAYYPRRLVRLYGPLVVAVALGVIAYALAPRYNDDELGTWVVQRPNDYPVNAVMRDITLVDGHSGRISPLWSLQWEVLFSLLLPGFVVLVTLGRRFDVAKVVALLGLCTLGSVFSNGPLTYLPMFGFGAVLASRWSDLGQRLSSWSARWRPLWFVVVAVAVLLTCSRWELTGLGVSPSAAGHLEVVAVPGVCLFVLLAGFCPWAVRLLTAPFVRWSGRISFSLYLVHEPILLS